jgi:hypothetical protein
MKSIIDQNTLWTHFPPWIFCLENISQLHTNILIYIPFHGSTMYIYICVCIYIHICTDIYVSSETSALFFMCIQYSIMWIYCFYYLFYITITKYLGLGNLPKKRFIYLTVLKFQNHNTGICSTLEKVFSSTTYWMVSWWKGVQEENITWCNRKEERQLWQSSILYKNSLSCRALVTHDSNPSYSGGIRMIMVQSQQASRGK